MIEKLFTSKNRVRLLEFFLVERGCGRLREISKKTNIPVSAISRELKNLAQLGIIKKDREIYELDRNCNIFPELRNMFIKTDSIVYPLKEALANKGVSFAFIFGSFAKGDYNVKSDVDLMVIGNIGLDAIVKKLSGVESRVRRSINPIVWTLENLKKEKKSGFVKDIFSKKIIMVEGDENELRKIVKWRKN